MADLSIVVATLGRPTLARTLSVLRPQLAEGDEVLLCPDGADALDLCRELSHQIGPQVRTIETWHVSHGHYGDPLKNLGASHATRDWLLFMDDDDAHDPDGLWTAREYLETADRVPHLFRVWFPGGHVLWGEPKLYEGNVSTLGICVPARGPLGSWRACTPNGRGGDYTFFAETVQHYGGRMVWHEAIIALCHGEGWGQGGVDSGVRKHHDRM